MMFVGLLLIAGFVNSADDQVVVATVLGPTKVGAHDARLRVEEVLRGELMPGELVVSMHLSGEPTCGNSPPEERARSEPDTGGYVEKITGRKLVLSIHRFGDQLIADGDRAQRATDETIAAAQKEIAEAEARFTEH